MLAAPELWAFMVFSGQTLDFDSVDRCFAKMAAAGFAGLIAVVVWMWPAIHTSAGFLISARWRTPASRRPHEGDSRSLQRHRSDFALGFEPRSGGGWRTHCEHLIAPHTRPPLGKAFTPPAHHDQTPRLLPQARTCSCGRTVAANQRSAVTLQTSQRKRSSRSSMFACSERTPPVVTNGAAFPTCR